MASKGVTVKMPKLDVKMPKGSIKTAAPGKISATAPQIKNTGLGQIVRNMKLV